MLGYLAHEAVNAFSTLGAIVAEFMDEIASAAGYLPECLCMPMGDGIRTEQYKQNFDSNIATWHQNIQYPILKKFLMNLMFFLLKITSQKNSSQALNGCI